MSIVSRCVAAGLTAALMFTAVEARADSLADVKKSGELGSAPP